MLFDRLHLTADRVTSAAAHRWRCVSMTLALGQPGLRNPDVTLCMGVNRCIGPRFGAAWINGTAMADDIRARL